MDIRFSCRLAICIGTVTPALEIARRWHQLGDLSLFWVWFDDVLLGAFLLCGALSVARLGLRGQPVLTAAWGFMCGLVYASFFGQLMALDQPDPSGVAPIMVVAVKGTGFMLAILGLVTALRRVDSVGTARSPVTT